ncbi:ATP-dependent nuclease [Paraburkholderia sp. MM5482-R1]|uniref:ATP-dependent nuclease n=1 Tax=unclassified Paraburkholderia TaxID=2615204 RepID=UPI003D1BE396
MKVVSLDIANFRGVRSAKILFDGHTLLIGANNVGKSTICEALDLVLGTDRLNRYPPIDEFDFYNAKYVDRPSPEGPPTLINIRIEVILIEFGDEIDVKCGGHTEFWHVKEQRLLAGGEIDLANQPEAVRCLRIETVGRYDPEEDEFRADTFFSYSPEKPVGELTPLPRPIKRLFGFLYLRTVRTGSRALSLERGSLLDIILRTKGEGVRAQLWEETIDQLRKLDVEASAVEIAPILRKVEKRLGRYVALENPGYATKLHVSDLTREHLRKTLSFFLALSADQSHVPFPHAGTGTIGTLILAMLSLIADLKPSTVIFAMEEPEIAVPPHTQRRIASYLKSKSSQAFLTSHSPFVIEQFEPTQTLLLSRDNGTVSARRVSDATGLKENEFKRFARWGLSECMLGKTAIVVEGITEFHALPVIARRMEERDESLQPMDIAGAALFNADGDGNGPKFGQFFKTLGLTTIAFHDTNPKHSQAKLNDYAQAFDLDHRHQWKGFEQLIVEEVPTDRLWTFLEEIKSSGENGNVGIPAVKPDAEGVRDVALKAFSSGKGAGWAARLFEQCAFDELPKSAVDFLANVYALNPAPTALDDGDEEDQLSPATQTVPPWGAIAGSVPPVVTQQTDAFPPATSHAAPQTAPLSPQQSAFPAPPPAFASQVPPVPGAAPAPPGAQQSPPFGAAPPPPKSPTSPSSPFPGGTPSAPPAGPLPWANQWIDDDE